MVTNSRLKQKKMTNFSNCGCSKQFRQAGLQFDDDLTRLQQKERRDLSDDFQALKSKGHKPFRFSTKISVTGCYIKLVDIASRDLLPNPVTVSLR